MQAPEITWEGAERLVELLDRGAAVAGGRVTLHHFGADGRERRVEERQTGAPGPLLGWVLDTGEALLGDGTAVKIRLRLWGPQSKAMGSAVATISSSRPDEVESNATALVRVESTVAAAGCSPRPGSALARRGHRTCSRRVSAHEAEPNASMGPAQGPTAAPCPSCVTWQAMYAVGQAEIIRLRQELQACQAAGIRACRELEGSQSEGARLSGELEAARTQIRYLRRSAREDAGLRDRLAEAEAARRRVEADLAEVVALLERVPEWALIFA